MNKQEIWRQLVDRYPTWNDPTTVVKLTARGLKALIDQAYDEGLATELPKPPPMPDYTYSRQEEIMAKFKTMFGFDPTNHKF